MNAFGRLCQLRWTWRGCRNLHVTRTINGYEAPGKTTVTFISKEIGARLLVMRCDEIGFTLNTGTTVLGPMIIFPRHAISWNVQSSMHINDASLSLFAVLEPKPDILIIGLDDQYDFPFIRGLQELTKKLDIPTEIVSVHNACTVFNFVNEEGRYVIGALIPRKQPKQPLRIVQGEPVKQITDIDNTAKSKTDDARTTSAAK